MTREQLEAYKSMREEIEELKSKLEHLGEGDSLISSDVVMDYSSGYPAPRPVVGYDYNKEQRMRMLYTRRKARLEKECAELEAEVEAIPDSLTRRIFRMHFMEGLSQEKTARKVHASQSSVSKKICGFFKLE